MMTIKNLFAAVLISSLAAASFAQTPAAPKNTGAPTAVAVTTDATAKPKVHKVKKAKAMKMKKARHTQKAAASAAK
jgi:hypothetical protein